MSYWWEAGGPHGYYHSDIYVFDLSTGEELSIKNFYPGTESEFKALIAEKINVDVTCEELNGNPELTRVR